MNNIIRVHVLEHNFLHVKNQWILVGKGSKSLPRQLHRIAKKAHQRFHWFVDFPERQMNQFNVQAICQLSRHEEEGAHPVKICIHVPKYAKDKLDQVYDWFRAYTAVDISIICEERGPCFGIHHKGDRLLNVYYDRSIQMIRTEIIFGHSGDFITNLNDYHVDPDPHELEKIAEKNKRLKIAAFKANSPMAILRTFKNEDDIWQFIQEEERAKKETISRRSLTLQASTDEEKLEAMNAVARTVGEVFGVNSSQMHRSEDGKKIHFSLTEEQLRHPPEEEGTSDGDA